MHVHRMTVSDAFAALRTSGDGLTTAEAEKRLAEFGSNAVEQLRRPSPFLLLLKECTHFLALVLWVAAGLAFVSEAYNPGAGMETLGYAIIGVIAINGAFSFWQQFRAERALEALEKLLPPRVPTMRDGQLVDLDAAALVPGDIILLEAGNQIPADCRMIETFAFRVNNATITGESVAVTLEAAACDVDDQRRAHNLALAGTAAVAGRGKALVFATGRDTLFARIAQLAQTTRPGLSPIQKEIARVSRLIALFATLLGVIFFAIGTVLGLPFWSNILFAIGIIVANVPEGLLPTVTLALAMASQRMARRNALVRHLPAVETLGAATVICSDKTGTLTQNRMSVHRLFLDGQLLEPGDDAALAALGREHPAFFTTCLLCEDVQRSRSGLTGDPMEVAIVEMAHQAMPEGISARQLDEVPFDAKRKRLSALWRQEAGLMLHTKGALETVLPLCSQVVMNGEQQPLTAEWRERFIAEENRLGAEGLRVLAVACRPVADDAAQPLAEENLQLLGLIALEDPPRPEVPAAIATCREAGIRVIMVTGDHPRTAVAIARQIGLVQSATPIVVTGDSLRRMSDAHLQLLLDAKEILFARMDPEQKTRLVATLQRKGEVVAMTGDGVNDAPALRLADIGVAMGKSGTDVARAAADLVLADDNFASIVSAVEEGRAVYANIRKFLTYILASNIPEIVPYLAFVLLRIPLPLTIIQILAVDLGTDMVPALGLGAERPEPETMRQPPRKRTERLLSGAVLLRAYGFLGVIEAAAAMGAYFFVLHLGGWQWGTMLAANDPLYRQATTACLTAIVAMQVANAFICRSDRESLFTRGPFTNRLLLAGVAVELLAILLINHTAAGNAIFGTMPFAATVWLLILPCVLAMILLDEGRKLLCRWALKRG
ncbi:MAG: cation-transporting P-type ATPase [Thermodesulfobacteriota bacterium]